MSTNRLHTITGKIDRETTKLNGSLFVHVDFDSAGTIKAVRFSFKGKDNSTLDRILTALGDAITGILRSIRERRG